MPVCCVPNCKNGYLNTIQDLKGKGKKGPVFFKIKKAQLEEYNRVIPRKDRKLTTSDSVCSEHFHKQDVEWFFESYLIDGKVIQGEKKTRPTLAPNAVPKIFPGCPRYLSKEDTKRQLPRRKPPDLQPTNDAKKRKNTSENVPTQSASPVDDDNENQCVVLPSSSLESSDMSIDEIHTPQQSKNELVKPSDCNTLKQLELSEGIKLQLTNRLSHIVKKVVQPDVEIAQTQTLLPEALEINVTTSSQSPNDEPVGASTTRPVGNPIVNTAQNDRLREVELPSENTSQPRVDFRKLKVPGPEWAVHIVDDVPHVVKLNHGLKITHAVTITGTTTEVQLNGVKVPALADPVKCIGDLELLLSKVNASKMCQGTGLNNRSKGCLGFVSGMRSNSMRCSPCQKDRKKIKRQQEREEKKLNKINRLRGNVKTIKRAKERIYSKVTQLRTEVKSFHKKCQNLQENDVDKSIQDLPPMQQEAVKTCFKASKTKSLKGMRYEVNWMYECMLMRIKSPVLYQHLREHNILPVPCRTTLAKYMSKLHPEYGYQKSLFDVLSIKTESWDEPERHGTIVVDEIKLEQCAEFDKTSLEFKGVTDIGNKDTLGNTGMLGDHALVMIFQPFQGGWFQSLGCFLSKGNAKADELAKIILEGVILCERASLRVDGVVCDGATWNRKMWEIFGITADLPSCVHPCDDGRRLWFFSDWCHLLKCMRNTLCPMSTPQKAKKRVNRGADEEAVDGLDDEVDVEVGGQSVDESLLPGTEKNFVEKILETPEGKVRRSHWVYLLEEDEKQSEKGQLRYVPKLTKKHVFPSGFERMKVLPAAQFFGGSTGKGMQFFRLRGVPGLKDSEITENLIFKINYLADAMNSCDFWHGLAKDSESEKVITEFLEYHNKCIELAKKNGKKCFWTLQTDVGLSVTLKATLELSNYLQTVGYTYLMTRRLTQDCIEQFFGHIRRAAGPNTHPDPKLFAQLYRLLTVYSLVRPVKGSNVSGGETLQTLMTVEDNVGDEQKEKQEQLDNILAEILALGEPLDNLPLPAQEDHFYRAVSLDQQIVQFMAGFTAFKQRKLVKDCCACQETLIKPADQAGEGKKITSELEQLKAKRKSYAKQSKL